VYIDGKLVGAIAYGFFAADHTIGGITPAEAMLEVLGYPATPVPPTGTPAWVGPATVTLPPAARQAAAGAAGVATNDFPATARQLPLPVGVSGLNDRGMEKLAEFIEHHRLPLLPYRAAASQPGGEPASGRILPGDSLAAVVSYGDLTFAGVGTATACSQERLVGFGHPFFFDGETTLGMNAAHVLTVVKDPSGLFGPFKIANLAETHGRIDQDRLAAVRGIEGQFPSLIPVTSSVTNLDLGKSRDGETDVVRQDLLPLLAAFHLLLNLDVTFDQIGEGSSDLEWTISGSRADGRPFELRRDDKYFSPSDITFESILELLFDLSAIAQNPFEDVHFTAVDVSRAEVTQEQLTTTVTRVLSATTSQPEFQERTQLVVQPGEQINLQVFLLPFGGSEERTVELALTVPEEAAGAFGSLVVRGGQPPGAFFLEPPPEGPPSDEPQSFEELLAFLAGAEHNYDLVAELALQPGFEEPEGGTLGDKVVAPQPRVVLGATTIEVMVEAAAP
ncbi:MAG: hypothetical protein M3N51_04580, partial [Actinomycetota bacterium]|nr:hypothetical protein [Actinomycetota bacterium]